MAKGGVKYPAKSRSAEPGKMQVPSNRRGTAKSMDRAPSTGGAQSPKKIVRD